MSVCITAFTIAPSAQPSSNSLGMMVLSFETSMGFAEDNNVGTSTSANATNSAMRKRTRLPPIGKQMTNGPYLAHTSASAVKTEVRLSGLSVNIDRRVSRG